MLFLYKLFYNQSIFMIFIILLIFFFLILLFYTISGINNMISSVTFLIPTIPFPTLFSFLINIILFSL